MIYANNIRDLNHVKDILDGISDEIVGYKICYNVELSDDYMEKVQFTLCEIDEFIIGFQTYNSFNVANSDLRMMSYWNYIDGECSYWNMLEMIKKYEGNI